MSAAALNLLMLNFNSQQSETGLNHRHPQNAGGPQTYPHSAASPTYPSYTHQYHQENSHHGALLTSPNGSPVRQLKRLHPGATNTATEFLRCRRRMELSSGGFGAPLYGQYPLHCRQVSSVARRNERERNRVRLVNNGFALLRQHVPSTAARSKKMSKVDTLKAAVDYIQQLRDILDDADSSVEESAAAASPSSSHSHHHHHHHPQGSLSPTSSTEGSCPDGAGSPGGYSSSSDGESSSSVSRGHHSIDDLGEEGDNKDVSELVDFASWFC